MRRVALLLLLLYRRSLQTYKRPIGRLSLCITCYRRAAMNAPQVCGVVRDEELPWYIIIRAAYILYYSYSVCLPSVRAVSYNTTQYLICASKKKKYTIIIIYNTKIIRTHAYVVYVCVYFLISPFIVSFHCSGGPSLQITMILLLYIYI